MNSILPFLIEATQQATLDSGNYLIDLTNPLFQIIMLLVIIAIIIMLAMLFSKKNELKAIHLPQENNKIVFEKEKLLNELKEEFKKN